MDGEKPFFRRIAEENNEIPDVWIYDELPKNVRVQILLALVSFLGCCYYDYDMNNSDSKFCKKIVNYLREEIGTESLVRDIDGKEKTIYNAFEELEEFFHKGLKREYDEKTNFRYALTVVEEICKGLLLIQKTCKESVDRESNNYYNYYNRTKNKEFIKKISDVICKINYRLREARIGWTFDYNAGRLIRIDNDFTHQLAVKPAFRLLSELEFQESADNFSKAFESYQEGTKKGRESAINYAVKALESVIRNICLIKKYHFDKNATLTPLIRALIDNKFLPGYNDDFLNALPKIFMAGGVIGNKNTRHARGDAGAKLAESRLTDNLVSFVLSQTASTIVFLAGNVNQAGDENANKNV